MVYPYRSHSPKMYVLMINFRGMIGALCVLALGMLVPKRFFLGSIEALLEEKHRGITWKKMVPREVTESMVMMIVIKHPHKVVEGTLTAVQEEMVVKLEVHMVPLVVIDPILTLLVVDKMVIMAPRWWWWCSQVTNM